MIVMIVNIVSIVSIDMMVVMMMLLLFDLIEGFFDFLNPGGGCDGLLEIEETGVEEFVKIHVAIVALYDFGFWLQGAYYPFNMFCLFLRHFRDFIKEDYIAELDLLNDEALYILFTEILCGKGVAGIKLAFESKGVDHRDDTVENRETLPDEIRSHGRHRTDGLSDGFGFANAACLDHYIVKSTADEIRELLHKIHLECAADTPVLKSHEAIVVTTDHPAFCDEIGINVDFTDIIHDNGEADSFTIVEYPVEKSGLTASEVSGQQQDRGCF